MALYLHVMRSSAISSLAIAFHQNMCRFVLRSSLPSNFALQHKSTNIDVLDIFTTHVLSKTTRKKRSASNLDSSTKGSQFLKKLGSNNTSKFVDWNVADIDKYLIISMDCGDREAVKEIVKQIIISKRLPSDGLILKVLCFLCDDSDNSMSTISRLIDVCKEKNIAFYVKNVDFQPFVSQHLWELQQFDDALNRLNAIYGTTNKISKSLILRNYRQIVYDAVKNQDESIVDKVIFNAKQINDRFKDPILMTYIWMDCFSSELFRNQKRADELFTSYDEIRSNVSRDIRWITLNFLQHHNCDAVYRLIEQCLGADMKSEVGVCLTALFNYHYWREDLWGCSEVMSTSLRLGTPMPVAQNQKLLNLLLKKKPRGPDKVPVNKGTESRFEFKF